MNVAIFSLAPVIIFFVAGFIAVGIIKGLAVWSSNNASPVQTVRVIVLGKRTNVSHNVSAGDPVNNMPSSHFTDTTYYVCFEFEDGGRREFHVPGREFGLIAEGDRGMLTYQGTRYKGFERAIRLQ